MATFQCGLNCMDAMFLKVKFDVLLYLFNLFFVCLFVQAFWPLQTLGAIVTIIIIIIIIILANISTVMGTLMVNVPGYSCYS